MTGMATGISAETSFIVSENDTATSYGSGLVAVYATPALVGLMEKAAVKALEGHLPAGQTTVGGRIDVRHLAATPVGMRVHARAELVEIQGRRLTFRVEAWDEVELIGEAAHERFIVDQEKFVARANAKAAALS